MNTDWQLIGIIISIILNIIFALLLFFKSALNDILKDWWIDRKKKKEGAIKRLIDFKIKFSLQQSQCSILIFTLSIKRAFRIMGREVDQFIEDSYHDSLSMSSKARNEISEFLDYLPTDLITHYKNYDVQFFEIFEKVIKDKVAKEDVKEYIEKITSLGLEITKYADSLLRNKFG